MISNNINLLDTDYSDLQINSNNSNSNTNTNTNTKEDYNYINQAKEIIKNKSAFVFEGGGVLGIAEVGALAKLKEMGLLNKIQNVVGTSVGSIIAAALGCGATVDYI